MQIAPSSVQSAAAHSHEFPKDFDAVPADARTIEALGITPITFAIGFSIALLGCAVGLLEHGFHGVSDLYIPAGCALGFVVFAGAEIWRRTSRYGLAFAGNQVGIYRKGQLQSVVPRAHVMPFKLSLLNTIRELMLFGVLAFFGLAGSAVIFSQPMIGLWGLGVGVALAGGFASSIYIRLMCLHYIVHDHATLAFTRGDAARLHLG